MNKLKTLPQPAQMALVAVVGLLVVAIGYLILLSPKQKQIASMNEQANAATTQYAADVARASSEESGSSAPQINVADIYKLTTAMPSLPDMPDLLIELNSTAKAAGVSLQSIGFGTLAPSADGTYSDIPITLQATGNFYTLTDLVYRLRNLVYVRDGALEANGRIFSISSIGLTPGGQNLSASITLDTYVYGSTNEAAVPGSTPTTTTPTSTTTTPTTTTTPSTSGATAAGATG